jgi:hypothetical protein
MDTSRTLLTSDVVAGRLLPSGVAWLVVLGFAVLLGLALLAWAARHVGGSTTEGDQFMATLGRSRSRFVRPGGGR